MSMVSVFRSYIHFVSTVLSEQSVIRIIDSFQGSIDLLSVKLV